MLGPTLSSAAAQPSSPNTGLSYSGEGAEPGLAVVVMIEQLAHAPLPARERLAVRGQDDVRLESSDFAKPRELDKASGGRYGVRVSDHEFIYANHVR